MVERSQAELRNVFDLSQSRLTFEMIEFTGEGFTETDRCVDIEGIAGGGFFGKVLLAEGLVIKTPMPGPLQEGVREKNWEPRPFPSRAHESAAKREYLAGRIIHNLFEGIAGGVVVTPNALGYTHLDGIGYSQVIERMEGRGSVFTDGGVENARIAKARNYIWDTGRQFGIEHAAQVHPDNPFGKQNIWVNGNNQIVWLDYLPAIPHKGKIWPFYKFDFHYDVQKEFGQEQPTFNTIHTDRFRAALVDYSDKFSEEEKAELAELLDQYDEATSEYLDQIDEDPDVLFVQDLISRGDADEKLVDKVTKHNKSLSRLRTLRLGKFAGRASLELLQKSPLRILWDKETRLKAAMVIYHREYRQQVVLEKTALRGIKAAKENGVVSEQEYSEALSFMSEEDREFFEYLQLGYIGASLATDAATVPFMLAAAKYGGLSLEETIAAGATFNTFMPGSIRLPATLIAGRIKKKKLGLLAAISFIPRFGAYVSLPIHLNLEYSGKDAGNVLHYNARNMVAAASNLFPDGGWNSDREERWWFESRIVDRLKRIGDFVVRRRE